MPTSDIAVVGRFGSPFGVKGWSHIQSFTSPADNLLQYRPWSVSRGDSGPWRELESVEVRRHHGGLIAKGAGVEDREQAQAMRGLWVGVGRDAFVPADAGEVYWYELEGCRVVDQDGRELGIVHELIETGAHDVLVIRRGKEEILIPFATAYVMHVDVAGGVLTVDWDPNWS